MSTEDVTSDLSHFHEIEHFPVVLIRNWYHVHTVLRHNGRVILIVLKSVEQFYEGISTLTSLLESSIIYE